MRLLTLSIAFAASLLAADQIIRIAEPLRQVDGPATPVITFDQARSLIESVLGREAEPDRSYVIHSVRYQNNRLTVESQKWYIYNESFSSAWTPLFPGAAGYFTETRIFGDKKLGVVYLHIVQGVPRVRALME